VRMRMRALLLILRTWPWCAAARNLASGGHRSRSAKQEAMRRRGGGRSSGAGRVWVTLAVEELVEARQRHVPGPHPPSSAAAAEQVEKGKKLLEWARGRGDKMAGKRE
jgi:hypothetical protein